MLTLEPVVNVNVSVSASVMSASSYDVGLIVTAATEGFTVATRVKTYSSLANVLGDFAATTDTYKAAELYFNVTPAPSSLVIGVYGSGESVGDTMTSIRNVNADWYGVFWLAATATQQLSLDEWLVANHYGMQFATVTGNVDTVLASEIVTASAARQSQRLVLLYTPTALEAAALMGMTMGCSRVYNDVSWQLCYKEITGLTPQVLPQSTVDALNGANISVYITRRYTQNLLERGSTPSTLRVDEVIALDKMSYDMQDACFELIARNPRKLPQTDDTSTQFMSAIIGVLEKYRNIGYIQPNIWRGAAFGNIATGDALEKGYSIWADSFDRQSDADRTARKAMPIYVGICFCGAVESVVINVNVQE